jgi:hypothetical protein
MLSVVEEGTKKDWEAQAIATKLDRDLRSLNKHQNNHEFEGKYYTWDQFLLLQVRVRPLSF